MQNYYTELVWKIDVVLVVSIFVLVVALAIYLFMRDYLTNLRRRRLGNLKSEVYELFLANEGSNACIEGAQKLSSRDFLDALSNRKGLEIFFNRSEQEHLKKCFINQENLLKIQRLANNPANKWRRIEAILALGLAEAPSGVPILEKGLYSKDTDISYFSLLALGHIKTELVLKVLLAFLKNNAPKRRMTAAVLENFPPFAAPLEVIRLVEDPDPEMRFWALTILSRFPVKNHIEKILKSLSDKEPRVRSAACECLGRMGGKIAEEALVASTKDDSWLVRLNAGRGLSAAMDAGCVKYVSAMLSDSSLNVSQGAKDILIKYASSALPYLEKILEGNDELAKRLAVEVLATGGEVKKILKEAALKGAQGGSREMKLVIAIIQTGARYSIESGLKELNEKERATVLIKIKGLINYVE